MNEFDENAAIQAMRAAVPDAPDKYSDDQLLNIIDMIWDFYEENGLLEIDADDQEEIDQDALYDDLVGYVKRMLRKDKGSSVDPQDVEALVKAEIDYENSIDS